MHYPHSQRGFAVHWVHEFSQPALTNFTQTIRPARTIQYPSEFLQAGAPPFDGSWGAKWARIDYTLVPPPGMPGGWNIGGFNSGFIQYYYYDRRFVFPVDQVPNTRPQRRVYLGHYAFIIRTSFFIRLTNVFNWCDITFDGYWGTTNDSEGPALVDFTETCALPTLSTCTSYCFREDAGTFDTLNTINNSVVPTGTVPTSVIDYMTGIRDTLVTDLQALTLDVKWRSGALPADIAPSVPNFLSLRTNVFGSLAY